MRRERFSIRKSKRGAVSACIAVFSLLLLTGVDEVAWAESVEATPAPELVSGATSELGATVANETIALAAPVTYVADETKEVGYHEVVETAQDGQLLLSETEEGMVAQRLEATPGLEVLGTKSEVKETVLEEAQTEYVANNQREFGDEVIQQEGQDAKDVTTTTYRIEVQESLKKNLAEQVSRTNKTNEDRPIYQGTTSYTIDRSQNLPSDQVVIDETALKEEVKTWLAQDDWQDRLGLGIDYDIKGTLAAGERTKFLPIILPNSELANNVNQYFVANTPSEAKYADVKAAYLHFQELVKQIRETYQGEELIDFIKTSGFIDWSWGKTYRTVGPEGSNRPELTHKVEGGYNPTDTALLRRYLAELDKAGVSYQVVSDDAIEVDGVVYPIKIQSSFDDFVAEKSTADDWTREEIVQKFEEWVATYETAFETQTKRYNNNHGQAQDLNILYKTQLMPEEERVWFEEQVAKLPEAIKRVFLRLVIQDEVVANSDSTRGVAWRETDQIQLRYPRTGSKEDLLRVFLHELSHVIDNNSWQFGTNFSNSKEFTELYAKHVNRPITRENPAVKPYYQDHIFESFAEFFGNYLLHRIYGYDYVKFIEVDGQVLTLRTYGDFLDNDEDAAKGRELVEKYYNDPRAYSPVAEAEWFFDKLYALLFEQPKEAKVVVDTIKTERMPVRHKIVEVGTKPRLVREVTDYTTIEVADSELYIGERQVKQIGQQGIIDQLTTYELVNKTTGEVVATTTSQVVQELVEEIIAIGTKLREVAPLPEKPQPLTPDIISPNPPQVTDTVAANPEVSQLDQSPLESEPVSPVRPDSIQFLEAEFPVLNGDSVPDGQLPLSGVDATQNQVDQSQLESVESTSLKGELRDRELNRPQIMQSTRLVGQQASPVADDRWLPVSETPASSYSRRSRATTQGSYLPTTGEALSALHLLGVSLISLGLSGLKSRRRSE